MLRVNAPSARRRVATLVAFGIGLAASAEGCAFVLDFPNEHLASTGGAGGRGGAGGMGTCATFASSSTVQKITWRVAMKSPATTDDVATTGLARDEAKGLVYAYGRTRAGLAGLFSESSVNAHVYQPFLVAVPDQAAATLEMGAFACTPDAYGLSGRMTLFSDGRPVVSGMLGADQNIMGPGSWSLSKTDDPSCTASLVSAPYDASPYFKGAPFFALIEPTKITANVAPGSDGMGVAVDDRMTHLAAIGVGNDQVFDAQSFEPTGKFFVQRSTEASGDTTFVLANHYREDHFPTPYVEAGIAVDDDGNAWFGGGSCDDVVACANQGAFFGVLGQAGMPELIVERPGRPSAITQVRVVDGVVLLGGHYDGQLSMLGASLPAGGGPDAFVVAVDAKTRQVLWTWPAADGAPTYDDAGFDSVVDLVALGTRACGAVYVAGCSDPSSGSTGNCAYPGKAKHGFIAKLDLGTGQEIAIDEATLENPGYDVFLPTALAASADRVWLAASVSGKIGIAGTEIVGASPMETVVVELTK